MADSDKYSFLFGENDKASIKESLEIYEKAGYTAYLANELDKNLETPLGSIIKAVKELHNAIGALTGPLTEVKKTVDDILSVSENFKNIQEGIRTIQTNLATITGSVNALSSAIVSLHQTSILSFASTIEIVERLSASYSGLTNTLSPYISLVKDLTDIWLDANKAGEQFANLMNARLQAPGTVGQVLTGGADQISLAQLSVFSPQQAQVITQMAAMQRGDYAELMISPQYQLKQVRFELDEFYKERIYRIESLIASIATNIIGFGSTERAASVVKSAGRALGYAAPTAGIYAFIKAITLARAAFIHISSYISRLQATISQATQALITLAASAQKASVSLTQAATTASLQSASGIARGGAGALLGKVGGVAGTALGILGIADVVAGIARGFLAKEQEDIGRIALGKWQGVADIPFLGNLAMIGAVSYDVIRGGKAEKEYVRMQDKVKKAEKRTKEGARKYGEKVETAKSFDDIKQAQREYLNVQQQELLAKIEQARAVGKTEEAEKYIQEVSELARFRNELTSNQMSLESWSRMLNELNATLENTRKIFESAANSLKNLGQAYKGVIIDAEGAERSLRVSAQASRETVRAQQAIYLAHLERLQQMRRVGASVQELYKQEMETQKQHAEVMQKWAQTVQTEIEAITARAETAINFLQRVQSLASARAGVVRAYLFGVGYSFTAERDAVMAQLAIYQERRKAADSILQELNVARQQLSLAKDQLETEQARARVNMLTMEYLKRQSEALQTQQQALEQINRLRTGWLEGFPSLLIGGSGYGEILASQDSKSIWMFGSSLKTGGIGQGLSVPTASVSPFAPITMASSQMATNVGYDILTALLGGMNMGNLANFFGAGLAGAVAPQYSLTINMNVNASPTGASATSKIFSNNTVGF